MPVFLRGRRAFCIIPAPPTSPRPTLIQSTVSPIRAVPTRTAPIRAAPATLRLPSATPTLTSPPTLRLPVTPTLTSPPPLPPPVTPTLTSSTPLPPVTPTLTSSTPLPPTSDTEAPHGTHLSRSVRTAARSAPLLPSCPRFRHGPRPFCCSARGPRPGARGTRGTKKGGRNRTEARPPPKSNQYVAAASPRQVIWLSGKSPFLKVGIRTPGNTRSSPAPKRTVFRYRAALRKVHHQANKATSRRSRTDN